MTCSISKIRLHTSVLNALSPNAKFVMLLIIIVYLVRG